MEQKRCKHGLYCKCYLCDLEKQITELQAENERLKQALKTSTRTNPLRALARRPKERNPMKLTYKKHRCPLCHKKFVHYVYPKHKCKGGKSA